MHFLTVVEAREWCRDRVELTDAGVPTRPSREQRFARGPTSDEVAFCRQVERALQPAADLVSYLQVGLLCGWDMHLLPAVGYARAFVSHDEYIECRRSWRAASSGTEHRTRKPAAARSWQNSICAPT